MGKGVPMATNAHGIEGLPELLTARQAAGVLQVSVRQVNRLCSEGAFKCAKVGNSWRINRDALAARYGIELKEMVA